MFEETLYQSAAGGKPFVDVLKEQGIIPGIKVDTGLQASSEHMMFTSHSSGDTANKQSLTIKM